MAYAYNDLRSLERLEHSRDQLEPLLSDFVERAEKARERGGDLVEAMDTLLSDFLEAGKRRLSTAGDEESADAPNHTTSDVTE